MAIKHRIFPYSIVDAITLLNGTFSPEEIESASKFDKVLSVFELIDNLKYYTSIKHLNLIKSRIDWNKFAVMKNIVSVNFSYYPHQFTEIDIDTIISKFPNLKHFMFSEFCSLYRKKRKFNFEHLSKYPHVTFLFQLCGDIAMVSFDDLPFKSKYFYQKDDDYKSTYVVLTNDDI